MIQRRGLSHGLAEHLSLKRLPFIIGAVLLGLGAALGTASRNASGEGTSTPVALSTATPASEPTLTPTLVPTATPTARPTPLPTSRPKNERHRTPGRGRRHARRRPTATPTATVVAPVRHHLGRRSKRARIPEKATPAPTLSPTPALTLQTEDSIAPVTCNGPGKPLARRPFLFPPYKDWTSIVSYFDHDSPNFLRDGLVITATGLRSETDTQHIAADFPAYWNRDLRQYVYYDGHNGYDFNLSYAPVFAAAAGKVIFAAYEYADAPDHGYGKMIMIDHRNGYVTLYGHFSKLLVKVGQKVRRGQQLGVSGNTGHSTGPHLHFTVFHNCSPTDPYGWTGQGPDPLSSYQGETSIYLWARQPLISNPLPSWPGLSDLPGSLVPRLLLLRLPPSRQGPDAFARALQAEAHVVQLKLARVGAGVKVNELLGAIEIRVPLSAAVLYALPNVASVASMDAAPDARIDVLSALSMAASHGQHSPVALRRPFGWTGYLFRWAGRTFLLGSGKRGGRLTVPFVGSDNRFGTQTIRANPVNGAYAADLGAATPSQGRKLLLSLRQDVRPRLRSRERSSTPKTVLTPRDLPARRDLTGLLVAIAVVLALAAVVFTTRPHAPD